MADITKLVLVLICCTIPLSASADEQSQREISILESQSKSISPEAKKELLREIKLREEIRIERRKILNSSKDWGECGTNCYENKNRCFDAGGESEFCDRLYDKCVAECD